MSDDEIEAITARIINLPAANQADFLLRMLEKVSDERDRLRKVIEHAIGTLTESASSAPGVLATVDLMRLALNPTGEGT